MVYPVYRIQIDTEAVYENTHRLQHCTWTLWCLWFGVLTRKLHIFIQAFPQFVPMISSLLNIFAKDQVFLQKYCCDFFGQVFWAVLRFCYYIRLIISRFNSLIFKYFNSSESVTHEGHKIKAKSGKPQAFLPIWSEKLLLILWYCGSSYLLQDNCILHSPFVENCFKIKYTYFTIEKLFKTWTTCQSCRHFNPKHCFRNKIEQCSKWFPSLFLLLFR